MANRKRDWMIGLVIDFATGLRMPETQWELDAYEAAVKAGFIKPVSRQ
jgi:hypothetical protein